MAKKKVIAPDGLAESVGPFSRAVKVGNILHIAGTTALSHVSSDYSRAVPPTIAVAGGTMEDIFKVAAAVLGD